MNYNKESSYLYKGKNIVFRYTDDPSLPEIMSIVDDISDGVINNITGYEPILREYFIVVSIISSLTTIELPESFNDSSEFIKKADIEKVVYNQFPQLLVEQIVNAADKKIDFKLKRVCSKTKVDELFDALISLVDKYGEMFNGTDVETMMEKLTSISDMAKMPKQEIVENILQFEKRETENIEN